MIIRETQYHGVQDEGDDWPPTQGIALVQWLLRKFDTVPKEFASTIEVILSASDDEQAIISIEYSRPPTQSEEAESKKLASEKKYSKVSASGFPNVSTKSFSEVIVTTSSIGPLTNCPAIAPIDAATAGITFVKPFSCTRTPGET